MNRLHILKWSIPVVFLALSIFCYTAGYGHDFLGLICLCLSALSVGYILIGMVKRRHRLVGKMLRTVLSTLVCIGLLVFAVTEGIILAASSGNPEESCEYVIVLGAKVNGTTPAHSLTARIDAAYRYLSAHPNTIAILSGGQGEDEDITEASCMFDQLTAMGIPAQQLRLEKQSTSTWENMKYSLALIESETGIRPEKVGILSSEYHLFRAGLLAKNCGFQAVGIPAYTPRFTIRLNNFLREVAGVWHYLILGGHYYD